MQIFGPIRTSGGKREISIQFNLILILNAQHKRFQENRKTTTKANISTYSVEEEEEDDDRESCSK